MNNNKSHRANDNLYAIYKQVNATCRRQFDEKKENIVLIGITGGIAAGKSTLARNLKKFIEKNLPWTIVATISTDNFIYPNVYLQRQNLMQVKGFPETYDWQVLQDFIKQIKIRQHLEYEIPIYSHTYKDILIDQFQTVKAADIYILEGVNVAFAYTGQAKSFQLFDELDLSLYLDTAVEVAKQRAIERFYAAYEKAKTQPTDYFMALQSLSTVQMQQYVESLWRNINVPLLKNYIAPCKPSANVIIDELPRIETAEFYVAMSA